jgi:hypothetical protein
MKTARQQRVDKRYLTTNEGYAPGQPESPKTSSTTRQPFQREPDSTGMQQVDFYEELHIAFEAEDLLGSNSDSWRLCTNEQLQQAFKRASDAGACL